MATRSIAQVVRELGETDLETMTAAIIEAKGGRCRKGHPLTPATLYVDMSRPDSPAHCRMCRAVYDRGRRERARGIS